MKSMRVLPIVVALALLLVVGLGITQAQGPLPQGGAPAAIVATAFTYQGQLNKDGTPVNAICDMRFTLWDGPVGATQIGDPDLQFVEVTEGLFDVQVNAANEFGDSAFQGDARYLKIEVKCTGDAAFVSLGIAQRLTAAPYALSLRPGARIRGDSPRGRRPDPRPERIPTPGYSAHGQGTIEGAGSPARGRKKARAEARRERPRPEGRARQGRPRRPAPCRISGPDAIALR